MSGHLFWLSIIAFGRGFLVELPPKSSWLSQETSEILPSDGVIFYTDGSLCEGRMGAGVFSDNLDIGESYALGSLATVFQTEVYAILACSDYCRSANMHNMTISKTSLLALSSYTIKTKLLHQCWLSLQDLSYNNRVRLFWVLGHCDIKGTEEADSLTVSFNYPGYEGGSLTHTLNTGSHLTAVDNLSFGLNTQSCKQPNTS
jgi:hypothetical protein